MYEYSALGCGLDFDWTQICSSFIILLLQISSLFLRLHSLWPKLLYLTPVQLETAFCSIHLAQQGDSDCNQLLSGHFTTAWWEWRVLQAWCPLPCCWLSRTAVSYNMHAWFCAPGGQWEEQRLHPFLAARTGSHLCIPCAWDMKPYLHGLFEFCRQLTFQCFPWNQQISVFLVNFSECVLPSGDSMISSPSENLLVVLLMFHMRKCLQR